MANKTMSKYARSKVIVFLCLAPESSGSLVPLDPVEGVEFLAVLFVWPGEEKEEKKKENGLVKFQYKYVKHTFSCFF